MKFLSKASLRQQSKHLFYEKTNFRRSISTDLGKTVREDSGRTFHDVSNGKTTELIRELIIGVMTDLTSKKHNNVRAGKGMKQRRLFVKEAKQTNGLVDTGLEKHNLGRVLLVQTRQMGQMGQMGQMMVRLCIVVVISFGLLSTGLLGGNAFAQQTGQLNAGADVTDTRLERYSTIVDILDESMFEFTKRPERSRERLALAKETFDLIRQGSGTSGGLIQGLDNTFARADTAITNQSIADFEIQTGLILGGLQRFLYETATREAVDGNVPLARSYIKRVIEDLNVLEGEKIRLTEAADAGALQAALEIAAGQSINNHLASAAEALDQEDQQAAYVSLANAYSGFVTVQDSLSMPPSVAQSLLTTIQDVVAQNPAAVENVAVLQKDMASYIQFNESVLEKFNADLLGQVPAQGQVQQNVGLVSGAQLSSGQLAGSQLAGSQAGLNSAAPQTNSIQNAVAQELSEQGSNAPQVVQQALNNQATNAAGQLGQGLETVRTPLSLGTGDGAVGVQETVQDTAEGAVRGVTLGAPSLVGTNGLNIANNSNGLNQGATGLSLNRPENNNLNNNANSTLNTSVRTGGGNSANSVRNTARTPVQAPVQEASFLDGLWNGLPKGIVMLLLALASFIPLYLLQLAFGSGSSNWLWVRIAVFLLLLPLMLEGIASFGSVLADITGISALGMLSPFTVSGGALGQMIWAGTSLVAISALCFGLWGICKQFGLLGGDAEEDAVVGSDADLDVHTDAQFQTNPSALTERFTLEDGPAGTVMDMGNETIIEWEDEF